MKNNLHSFLNAYTSFAFETPQFITKKNDIHLSSINKVFVAGNNVFFFHPHRKLTSLSFLSSLLWKNYSWRKNLDGKITYTILLFTQRRATLAGFNRRWKDDFKRLWNNSNDKTKTQIEIILVLGILAGGKNLMMVTISTDALIIKIENTAVVISINFDNVTTVLKTH
jgi:hypothetical protein